MFFLISQRISEKPSGFFYHSVLSRRFLEKIKEYFQLAKHDRATGISSTRRARATGISSTRRARAIGLMSFLNPCLHVFHNLTSTRDHEHIGLDSSTAGKLYNGGHKVQYKVENLHLCKNLRYPNEVLI